MPSTAIRSYSFDERNGNLLITFVSGMQYVYQKVPVAVFENFKKATSRGSFFNRFIKPHYAFKKIGHSQGHQN